MPNLHNIEIDKDDQNMLRWGDLLVDWIQHPANRPPQPIADFNAALAAAGVNGRAFDNGIPNRLVEIRDYTGTGNIIIPVPSEAMLLRDWQFLSDQWDAGNRTYPIPDFYRFAYQGNPAKRVLTKAQMKQFAKMRLGEYVINECM